MPKFLRTVYLLFPCLRHSFTSSVQPQWLSEGSTFPIHCIPLHFQRCGSPLLSEGSTSPLNSRPLNFKRCGPQWLSEDFCMPFVYPKVRHHFYYCTTKWGFILKSDPQVGQSSWKRDPNIGHYFKKWPQGRALFLKGTPREGIVLKSDPKIGHYFKKGPQGRV